MKFLNISMKLLFCFIILFSFNCKSSSNEEELRQVYQKYKQALQRSDIQELQKYLSSEKQEELSGEGLGLKLEMVKQFIPTTINIKEVIISGNSATLKAEGQREKQTMIGSIELKREGGKWKVFKEEWSIQLGDAMESNDFDFPVTKQVINSKTDPPQPHLVLKGHQSGVSQLVFTPDSRYLISASYGDFSIRIWDVNSGHELSYQKTKNRIRNITITPEGDYIITADAYNYILSWPIEMGNTIGPQKLLTSKAGDEVALSPDKKYFATTALKKPLRIWNFNNNTLIKELDMKVQPRVLTFSKSGDLLVSAGKGNTFSTWTTKNWKSKTYKIKNVSQDSDVSSLDISNNDKYLAIGHMDSSIIIFDLKKRKVLHNFYVPNAATMDIKFSPDGNFLATAQYNNSIYIWDTQTAKRLFILKKHAEAVSNLAFSPDGTMFASASEDKSIIIWKNGPPQTQTPNVEIMNPQKISPKFEQNPGQYEEFLGKRNYIINPFADQDSSFWQSKGDVEILHDNEDNPFFVVRYNGMFWQDATIPESTGRWALVIAWSNSERINKDGDQAGLPYLYGHMINYKDKNRFNGYLNGPHMLHSNKKPHEWGIIWGAFKIPKDTGQIRIYLQQADGHLPKNGSACFFDDIGIFLFDTETEATKFVNNYK
jgi:6-phosphogluconolactonase (cycloisomerase 2 family)